MARAEPAEPARSDLLVEVLWCAGPHAVEIEQLRLPAGATLAQALQASRLCQAQPEAVARGVGVWGRVRALDYALHPQDRIELYRPLTVDPKEARRQRYKGQRAPAKQRLAAQRAAAAPAGTPAGAPAQHEE